MTTPTNRKINKLPLCIDLDGTLIETDVTWLATKIYLHNNIFNIFNGVRLAAWMSRGRAYYKHKLASVVSLDPKQLPYRSLLMGYLKAEQKAGRSLYLATAADITYATAVSDYLGLFTKVFASDGITNLRADAKAHCLVQQLGEKKFVYAGNSFHDLAIWQHSAQAIVCSNNANLLKAVKKLNIPLQQFE
jgi:hypothetical protein